MNSIPYTIEGYIEDNQLYFDLVTNMKGIEPKAIASHVPLISNIACVSDHYQGQLVRCRNMSGNHDWSLEYTMRIPDHAEHPFRLKMNTRYDSC
ncbi:hypothetical protein [Dasania marina]|uniref:hypothetical protein n=1 Tax=Dasania marina TaxID=471499 RepID=UPI0030DD7F5D